MPSESIEDAILSHMTTAVGGGGYNAQSAHDYYLRTRKLKGRTSAAVKPLAGKRIGTTRVSAIRKKAGPTKTTAQRHSEMQAKVKGLQGRLDKLNKLLAVLVKQAKARGGVPIPTKSDSKTASATASGGSQDSASKLTAQQKAAQAKSSKDFYEKHKNDASSANVAAIEEKIKIVTAKIVQMRADLAASRQQAQA